jgi:flagellar assembly protein FliH
LFESARVLNAKDYATASQPYLMEKVAAAAVEDLRRKREEARLKAAEGSQIDPQALRQREEAAELRAQAARLLKEAQAKAESMVAEAQVRSAAEASKAKAEAAKEGLAQGTASGFETGQKQGSEEGLARYREGIARFQALLDSAKAEKEAYFTDREALLVELAVRIAAKVIHREVATGPEHIQNLLRQAIRKLSDKSILLVYLNPQDLERVTQARADGLLKLSGVKQVEFLADDKMVAGGLRVASGHQTLDAALDSQLAEICRGLLEEAYHEA